MYSKFIFSAKHGDNRRFLFVGHQCGDYLTPPSGWHGFGSAPCGGESQGAFVGT
jgi:hypothetical protein